MKATAEMIDMLDKDIIQDVAVSLNSKNINKYTIDHVIDFLALHNHCFGNIIDTKEVAKRLINNIDYNITSFVAPGQGLIDCMFYCAGCYVDLNPRGKNDISKYKIWISPVERILNKITDSNNLDSTIRHELNHASTAFYVSEVAPNGKRFFDQRIGFDFDVSFENSKNLKTNLLNLSSLVEGIAKYKQDKYDEALRAKKSKVYRQELELAEHFINMFGEKIVLTCDFYGDYLTLFNLYKGRTGLNLNEVISSYNEVISNTKFNPLLDLLSYHFPSLYSTIGEIEAEAKMKLKSDSINANNIASENDILNIDNIISENKAEEMEL